MSDEVFDAVREAAEANGVFDLVRVTTFGGFRLGTGDERPRAVTIRVHDSGTVADPNRWSVFVTDDERRSAQSDATTDLDVALRMTPWSRLDEAPD